MPPSFFVHVPTTPAAETILTVMVGLAIIGALALVEKGIRAARALLSWRSRRPGGSAIAGAEALRTGAGSHAWWGDRKAGWGAALLGVGSVLVAAYALDAAIARLSQVTLESLATWVGNRSILWLLVPLALWVSLGLKWGLEDDLAEGRAHFKDPA